MAAISAHGIALELPSGWDGVIYRRPAAPGEASFPITHCGNFALPTQRGDFGGGAVEAMGPFNVFVSLFEYGPAAVTQPMFATVGLPLPLGEQHFNPAALQRIIAGQAGYQQFFQTSARAFSIYVVLGNYSNRHQLVPQVNAALSGLSIGPMPTSSPPVATGATAGNP